MGEDTMINQVVLGFLRSVSKKASSQAKTSIVSRDKKHKEQVSSCALWFVWHSNEEVLLVAIQYSDEFGSENTVTELVVFGSVVRITAHEITVDPIDSSNLRRRYKPTIKSAWATTVRYWSISSRTEPVSAQWISPVWGQNTVVFVEKVLQKVFPGRRFEIRVEDREFSGSYRVDGYEHTEEHPRNEFYATDGNEVDHEPALWVSADEPEYSVRFDGATYWVQWFESIETSDMVNVTVVRTVSPLLLEAHVRTCLERQVANSAGYQHEVKDPQIRRRFGGGISPEMQ